MEYKPVLIDVGACCEHHTNQALEFLHKAISEDPNEGIWEPHQSVLLRRMVELFTQRGLQRLEAVQKAILKWQAGDYYVKRTIPPARPDAMLRWSPDELDAVKLYLESLPPDQWTLDDHMLSIDYVVQRYLPKSALTTEAEWLSTKAGLMGKVQANLKTEPTIDQADAILDMLPSTVAAASQQFQLTNAAGRVLDFARVRACENVVSLSDSVRHRMRYVVAADLEQRQTGNVTASLESKLFDEFGQLNRDWRRIAVTEAGESMNTGMIASLPVGAKVKRIEQYKDACPFCKRIHGVVMNVVDPADPKKNPEKDVWTGKNNIGRSASPRRRQGGTLVERTPDEMWQIPSGLVHPHCRGRWVVAEVVDEEDDPEFAEILRGILG